MFKAAGTGLALIVYCFANLYTNNTKKQWNIHMWLEHEGKGEARKMW